MSTFEYEIWSSTSALDDDQVGWDWFALQLDEGIDIMYYQLRDQQGHPDPLSKGRWMPMNQDDVLLQASDVSLQAVRYATMPSGNRYPVAWRLKIPAFEKILLIEAIFDAQEMGSFIAYWEGAVDVYDQHGAPIGRGFVELTGYDRINNN